MSGGELFRGGRCGAFFEVSQRDFGEDAVGKDVFFGEDEFGVEAGGGSGEAGFQQISRAAGGGIGAVEDFLFEAGLDWGRGGAIHAANVVASFLRDHAETLAAKDI